MRALLLDRLGMSQWDCGLFNDAIKLYDQSIATCGDNPDTIYPLLNKAVALRDLGELQEVAQIINHHLSTEQATDFASLDYTNLASIYRLQGECAEAMEVCRRTVAAMDGLTHLTPARLLTLHSQAALHEEMGNDTDAIQIMTDVFNSKVDTLGICRTATLKTAISLRRMLAKNGQAEQAIEIADRIRPYLEYA
jgi:tetratricopeptide (TPR) repeat protein